MSFDRSQFKLRFSDSEIDSSEEDVLPNEDVTDDIPEDDLTPKSSHNLKTIVDSNGDVLLLAKDLTTLEEEAKAIIEYSKKSYPETKIGEINIEKLPTITPDRYTLCLTLNSLLPPLITILIQISYEQKPSVYMSGHGMAVVSAGIFPVVTSDWSYPKVARNHSKETLELFPGSIIDYNTDYPFVYISPRTCLVYYQGKLQFYPYDLMEEPPFMLRKIYTKSDTCVFSQSFLNNLTEYYTFIHNNEPQLLENRISPKLKSIMTALHQECVIQNTGSSLFTAIYENLCRRIDARIIRAVVIDYEKKKRELTQEPAKPTHLINAPVKPTQRKPGLFSQWCSCFSASCTEPVEITPTTTPSKN